MALKDCFAFDGDPKADTEIFYGKVKEASDSADAYKKLIDAFIAALKAKGNAWRSGTEVTGDDPRILNWLPESLREDPLRRVVLEGATREPKEGGAFYLNANVDEKNSCTARRYFISKEYNRQRERFVQLNGINALPGELPEGGESIESGTEINKRIDDLKTWIETNDPQRKAWSGVDTDKPDEIILKVFGESEDPNIDSARFCSCLFEEIKTTGGRPKGKEHFRTKFAKSIHSNILTIAPAKDISAGIEWNRKYPKDSVYDSKMVDDWYILTPALLSATLQNADHKKASREAIEDEGTR